MARQGSWRDAVQQPVDRALQHVPQRQRDQRRDPRGQQRDAVPLLRPHDDVERRHRDDVGRDHAERQPAVDERPVEHDVDIEQVVVEDPDRKPDRQGKRDQPDPGRRHERPPEQQLRQLEQGEAEDRARERAQRGPPGTGARDGIAGAPEPDDREPEPHDDARDDDRELDPRPRAEPLERGRRREPRDGERQPVAAEGDEVRQPHDPRATLDDGHRRREHEPEVDRGRPHQHVHAGGEGSVEGERAALHEVARRRAEEPRHAAARRAARDEHERGRGRDVRAAQEHERRDGRHRDREHDDAPALEQRRRHAGAAHVTDASTAPPSRSSR